MTRVPGFNFNHRCPEEFAFFKVLFFENVKYGMDGVAANVGSNFRSLISRNPKLKMYHAIKVDPFLMARVSKFQSNFVLMLKAQY